MERDGINEAEFLFFELPVPKDIPYYRTARETIFVTVNECCKVIQFALLPRSYGRINYTTEVGIRFSSTAFNIILINTLLQYENFW